MNSFFFCLEIIEGLLSSVVNNVYMLLLSSGYKTEKTVRFTL